MTLAADWREFIKRGKEFPRNYFDGIFKVYRKKAEIEAICDYDGLRSVGQRVVKLIQENRFSGRFDYVIATENAGLSCEEREALVRKLRSNIVNCLHTIQDDELATEIGLIEIYEDVGRSEFQEVIKNENSPHMDWVSIEADYGWNNFDVVSRRTFNVLKESVFQLTMSLPVTHYIFDEILDFPMKYDGHYELFKNNSDIFIDEARLIGGDMRDR